MRPPGGSVLYIGPSPGPVEAAAHAHGASVAQVAHPEDALGFRGPSVRLVLLHVPQATQWLSMLRANFPRARFVLLGHPQRGNAERTHPWRVVGGVLDAPLGDWLAGVEEPLSSPPHLPAPSLREEELGGRRWMLLNLRSDGSLARAYGWTTFTGQPLEQARGDGWLDMLENPLRWGRLSEQTDHVNAELGVYNARTRTHHRCRVRAIRTSGWQLHLEDLEPDARAHAQLEHLEGELCAVREALDEARRRQAGLRARLAEEREVAAQLLESLQEGGPAASAAALVDDVARLVARWRDDGAASPEAWFAELQGRVRRHHEHLVALAAPVTPRAVKLEDLVEASLARLGPALSLQAQGTADVLVDVDRAVLEPALACAIDPDQGVLRLSAHLEPAMVFVALAPVRLGEIAALRGAVLRHGGRVGRHEPEAVWLTLPLSAIRPEAVEPR